MAGNIKGITIEFRGDTSKLSQAINQIRKEGRSLDREMRQIDRALKFNPRNLDLWRQKQTLLNQKVKETRRHLSELKAAEAQMRANGIDQNSAVVVVTRIFSGGFHSAFGAIHGIPYRVFV